MKYRIEYLGMKGTLDFLAALSPERRIGWGGALGRVWYAVDRKHRRLAVENIQSALGLDRPSSETVAKRCFENIGRNLAEFAAFTRFEQVDRKVTIEGIERLKAALARGKGAFIVSGHFGNWELIGASVSRVVPLTVVARPMKNPLTDALINERRRRAGLRVVGHRRSTRPILAAIGRGEAVGVLLDQNTSRREAVFVNFLGRPAAANFGLALLAAKSGAPVLPAFMIREGDSRHRAVFGEPLELVRREDRREELGVNTARFTAAIEKYVREYPELWFWVHNRWKNQPLSGERTYLPVSLGAFLERKRIAVSWLFAALFLIAARPSPVSVTAGFPLTLAGAVLRTWASGFIRKQRVLATGGPYAYTRNPLYLGSMVIALGALVMAGSWWLVALFVIVSMPVYLTVMRREETFLKERFGKDFHVFKEKVPLFFPRLYPYAGRRGAFSWPRVRRHREWRVWAGILALTVFMAGRAFL